MTGAGDHRHAIIPITDINVLGPLTVHKNGHPVPLTQMQGKLLGVLASADGHLVNKDTIQRLISGREPTKQTDQTMRRHLADTRRVLGTTPPRSVTGTAIIATGTLNDQPGYRINRALARIDAPEYEQHVTDGILAMHRREWKAATTAFGAASALWRGDPLSDVSGPDFLRGWKERITSSRQTQICGHAEAMLRLGRHEEITAPLITHTATYPGNGLLWQLLVIALYADHRDNDASQTLRRGAIPAFDRNGLDPAYFQQLHQAVLRQSLPRDASQALDDLGLTRRALDGQANPAERGS